MKVQIGDIFHGVTPAPVRSFIGDATLALKPRLMIHPCVGRFGALTACVQGRCPAERHQASDLNLYTTLLGTLAAGRDPRELNLRPDDEVRELVDVERYNDPFDYAAACLLGMKYVQLRPINRYLDGHRRELRLRFDDYLPQMRRKLENLATPIQGIDYRVRNLWDVIDELEAQDPAERDPTLGPTVLFMSMTWYRGDFTKQMQAAEAAFGWPGLVGREFNPETLPELLARCAALENMTVFAHVGWAVYEHVPLESYTPVVAYVSTKDGKIDRLICNRPGDLPLYAPNRIKALDPKRLPIWDDKHELTENSKLTMIELDTDTALYLRDLFVHRLGVSRATLYYAMLLDGRVVSVFGIMPEQVLGQGKQDNYVKEQFGVSVTSERYKRFNRLAPLALTSGDFRKLLLASYPALQVRDVAGVQSTDIRHYNDSKVKRGAFRAFKKEQQPDGLWKILTRGAFRDDNWDDCYRQWWGKWGPDALAERQRAEAERKALAGQAAS